MKTETLGGLVLAGLSTELDYVSADVAAKMIERETYLLSCDADEVESAAESLALAVSQ